MYGKSVPVVERFFLGLPYAALHFFFLHIIGAVVAAPFFIIFFLASPAAAESNGFVAGVTPARFELQSKSGHKLRRSFKIFNYGEKITKYRVRTVEWAYAPDGGVSFFDELAPDSCRPWVALERHEVTALPDPRSPRNFRFEITVPEDAPRRECRFALMIEGLDHEAMTQFGGGSLSLPVTGRVAIIVYLALNGAEPKIEVSDIALNGEKNSLLPVVKVVNSGDAHGRLEAELWAKDSKGQKMQLSFGKPPVLAKQQRNLKLSPVRFEGEIHYPLRIEGKIYVDDKTYEVDKVLSATIDQPS